MAGKQQRWWWQLAVPSVGGEGTPQAGTASAALKSKTAAAPRLTDSNGASCDWDEAEERQHQAALAAAGAPHNAAAHTTLRGLKK
jgi:hypothetical protein